MRGAHRTVVQSYSNSLNNPRLATPSPEFLDNQMTKENPGRSWKIHLLPLAGQIAQRKDKNKRCKRQNNPFSQQRQATVIQSNIPAYTKAKLVMINIIKFSAEYVPSYSGCLH